MSEADHDLMVLSGAEKRFDRWRRRIGLFLGPAASIILILLPLPGLSLPAHKLAAIFIWIGIWWVTEPVPIPVSALLGALLSVLAGVAPAKQVFAPFADPIIYLFLGSFLLAEGMSVHGLHLRFAQHILSRQWIRNSPARLLWVYGAVGLLLSMWISNTATTAILFPIGLGLIASLKSAGIGQRFATSLMLMAAYASSVGGIGTPVGTPPNLIGIAMIEKFAGLRISFAQWMLFAVPLLLFMYLLLFALLYLLHRPGPASRSMHDLPLAELPAPQGALSRGERNTLFAFIVTVILWLAPGAATLFLGPAHSLTTWLNQHLPEAAASLAGAILLFILPTDWRKMEFTLSWRHAVDIDWGTLLFFGGGMAMGQLMFDTKLADAIGRSLLDLSGAQSVWTVTLAAIYISIIVTEFMSNTAAANMVVPVLISLALAMNINPIPPALGATIGASLAFLLPVSTPPNAIVYGSGLLPITKMVRAGFLLDVLGGLSLWLGLRIILPLVGLA